MRMAPDRIAVPGPELERRARSAVAASTARVPARPDVFSAVAPGRCVLVGDHVDYAGGLVLCAAIDLHVAVALRQREDGVERGVVGDDHRGRADYVLAATQALRAAGVDVPPIEAATSASLPPGAGLASSAAVVCATVVALLRLRGGRMAASAVVDAAYEAEHNVLGVPCGRLDQHAVVESPERGALLFDAAADAVATVAWNLADVVLVVCDTAERHSVAGPEYARRRAETAAALELAGMETAQQPPPDARAVDAGAASGAGAVPWRRLRHVVGETRRAAAAADALRGGDARALGRLMSESHRSLRDDHEVSTPALDAVAAAAEAIPGCHGARMVGAGFGGSVLALTDAGAAGHCADAMRAAAGERGAAWILRPSPGLARTASDVIARG